MQLGFFSGRLLIKEGSGKGWGKGEHDLIGKSGHVGILFDMQKTGNVFVLFLHSLHSNYKCF